MGNITAALRASRSQLGGIISFGVNYGPVYRLGLTSCFARLSFLFDQMGLVSTCLVVPTLGTSLIKGVWSQLVLSLPPQAHILPNGSGRNLSVDSHLRYVFDQMDLVATCLGVPTRGTC